MSRAGRPNGRALFTPVATGVTCTWCQRYVDVEPDPVEGVNRYVEHNRMLKGQPRAVGCAGSGRPVTSSPASAMVDRLLGDH